MSVVFCNQCGHRNPERARYCSSCGAALEEQGAAAGDTTITFMPDAPVGSEGPEDELQIAAGDLPEGVGALVVKRGPNAGSRFVLEDDVTTVGRHPDSGIFLDDITVSRRHAEFVRQGKGYVVRDVGSLNGTYLNRERIEEGALANGDEVQVGKFKLVFLTSGAEA